MTNLFFYRTIEETKNNFYSYRKRYFSYLLMYGAFKMIKKKKERLSKKRKSIKGSITFNIFSYLDLNFILFEILNCVG